MSLEVSKKNVPEAKRVDEKEEIDTESEDGDVSPFVLTPISFRSLVGHDDEVNACCFSPDWSRLISGGDDWAVKVWDTSSGQPVYTLTSHKGENMHVMLVNHTQAWLRSMVKKHG
jgi:WD40 repeat protein